MINVNVSEKSLQINIDSVDDARAVIQHLKRVKSAYDAHGCTSVELAIAEQVATDAHPILAGAIPWCTTFRKLVKPFGENVLFELPHYRPLAPRPPVPDKEPEVASARAPKRVPPRPSRRKIPASPPPLVQAPPDGG